MLPIFFDIYNLHIFKQKVYLQILTYLNVPRIPVKKPLENSWRTTGCVNGDLCNLFDWETFIDKQKGFKQSIY